VPIAQTLIPEFDEEMASTRRALERVPTGKAPLGRLATLLAELPSWALNAVTLDELDIAPPGGPPFQPVILETGKEILDLLDRNVQATRKALTATSDAEFVKPWTFKYGGRTMWTKTKRDVYRNVLNHLVHHRGQLTVYLRMNDVPVPAIYGPSADEQGFRP